MGGHSIRFSFALVKRYDKIDKSFFDKCFFRRHLSFISPREKGEKMSEKTNALRICDREKVTYTIDDYDVKGGFLDGMEVADLIHKPYDHVFKTLVTIGKSGQIYIFVIPVHKNLDLKKAAMATKEKSIDMLLVSKLLESTGYVKGGCSPIGMKKGYPIYFDEALLSLDQVTFNAGKVGKQMTLTVEDIEKVISYKVANITKEGG